VSAGLYQDASFRRAAGAVFRPGGLLLTQELAEACRLQPGERVLDLGCGVGATAAYLAERWVVTVCGLDRSPAFLAEARSGHPELDWVLGEAGNIPLPDGEFDTVFAECFLSGVDARAVLAEVRRVLRPGGRLALSDVYLRHPEAGALPFAPAVTCLRGAVGKEETMDLLRQSGFAVKLWEDRSDALKELMASVILSYGSAADFWKATLGEEEGDVDLESLSRRIAGARPGYYLLVAEAVPSEGATGFADHFGDAGPAHAAGAAGSASTPGPAGPAGSGSDTGPSGNAQPTGNGGSADHGCGA
jgi:arsenite methyltransferase